MAVASTERPKSKSQVNIEAEQCLLGSMLAMPECIDAVQNLVSIDDFTMPEHQVVYEIAVDMRAKGKPLDSKVLEEEVIRRDKGGVFTDRLGTLLQIVDSVSHGLHADYFAGLVHDAAIVRRVAALGVKITDAAKAHNASDTVVDLLTASEQQLHALMETLDTGGEPMSLGALLVDTLASIGAAKRRGTPTGFYLLDRITNGWQPGNLIILAGRPGAGKTAMLCNMMIETARAGHQVLVFSMEQTQAELSERCLAYESGVNADYLKDGTAVDDDYLRNNCLDAANRLHEMPIMIDDTPGLTVSQISSKARRVKRRKGLKLIIIDYLQIAEPTNRKDPREQQVALMSRSLKNLARELEVPIVCLAQLNRDAGKRNNKRPLLMDLRESGSLEQDANIVAFIHRPVVYDDGHPEFDSELIIAKNRDGKVGQIYLDYAPHLLKFKERDPQVRYEPPPKEKSYDR